MVSSLLLTLALFGWNMDPAPGPSVPFWWSAYPEADNTLFEELKAQNKMPSLNSWNKIQVKFLSVHHFFTKTANGLREVNKQAQIERIKDLVDWDAD